ncbi:MAG: hypothetical protein O3C39_04530 [Planctomycetota bacterium]|jgi:hypothetical protein|nr:hypothetical protein [Pirellulales bacterium]MDA1200930.1 hypothetical protein [Planctomycetota bacterium]
MGQAAFHSVLWRFGPEGRQQTAALMHHKGRRTGDPSADPLAVCGGSRRAA